MSSLYVVQTNAVPGCERAFHEWYDNRHLGDLLSIPGFESARRYERSESQLGSTGYPYRFLALYELGGDVGGALEGLTTALAKGLEMSDALADDRISVVYDQVSERSVASASGQSPPHLVIALANAVPGQVHALDDWYDNRILDEVIALPGFVSASRYVRSSTQRESRAHLYPYRSIAFYEVEVEPQIALNMLKAAALSPSTPIADEHAYVVFDRLTEGRRS